MKKRLFVLLGIIQALAFSALDAEYLIVRATMSSGGQVTVAPVTQDDPFADAVYNVITTYQWPMCLAHLDRISETELEELCLNEESFLRIKIKEISNEFDLIFIPTTLYELAVINDKEAHPTHYTEPESLSVDPNEVIDPTGCTSYVAWIEKFRQLYSITEMKNVYFQANTAIFKIFNAAHTLEVGDLIAGISNLADGINVVGQSIKADIDAQRAGKFLLFRGIEQFETQGLKPIIAPLMTKKDVMNAIPGCTSRIETTHWTVADGVTTTISEPLNIKEMFQICALEVNTKKIEEQTYFLIPMQSTSFGNSLFAGYYLDADIQTGAATAFYLIMNRTGYIVSIQKKLFLNTLLSNKNFFCIPPIPTIIALLYGCGEFFHPRSSLPASLFGQQPSGERYLIQGIEGKSEEDPLIDGGIASIYWCNISPMAFAEELTRFVGANSTLIEHEQSSPQALLADTISMADRYRVFREETERKVSLIQSRITQKKTELEASRLFIVQQLKKTDKETFQAPSSKRQKFE